MVDKNCRLHLLTTGEFNAVAAPVATDVNFPNLALTIIWCCAGARVLTLAQVSRFLGGGFSGHDSKKCNT